MRRTLMLASALAALAVATPSLAQQRGSLDKADRTFVEKAASGGLAEVEMGQMAQQKAQNDQVRQFGQRMVDDHSRANQQLQQIAANNNITLPSGPDSKHRTKSQEMQKLSGARFDRAYMQDMVQDHRQDIALFEKEAKQGKNADLKQFAEQTLPTLREHYDLAKRTEAGLAPAQASATQGKGHGTMSSGSSGTMNRSTGSSQAQ
ncbi:DUF4142 domain-containing protein [Azospirillum canadense]|uniref:DUF4142 domain-containing protein n=1 Tax=Azospirillum canadense TaxID=403962 RepID=UPI0022266A15|nr:DUF4142 domain-containing protein [Azospirillum canadense]MCW2238659.1 putative membrane protein [Azospirillum canadense]